MTRYTYSIDEDTETLVGEESFDEFDNLIHAINYRTRPAEERKYSFNELNQLILEVELSDGVEINRIEYSYDEDGVINEQNLYFGSSLYESTRVVKTEAGSIRTIVQDGVEIEKCIEKIDGKNYVVEFYENGAYVETQEYMYDRSTNTGKTRILDAENNLFRTRVETFGRDGEVLKTEEFTPKDSILTTFEYEFDGEHLSNITFRDHSFEENSYIHTYLYDSNNRLIKSERRTITDQLIEFHTLRYDKDGLVEESGFSMGNVGGGVYGTHGNGGKFHFRHTYTK